MSQSIGVSLSMLWFPLFLLLKITQNTIKCLESLYKAGILHRDVSINNIMCIPKKVYNIVLENDACVSTNTPTLLVDDQNSGLMACFNNYNLVIYTSKTSNLTTLTGTWMFIVSSRLRRCDIYYTH